MSEKEGIELDYILKKELNEMLLDLADQRLGVEIKQVIRLRFRTVYDMYSRYGNRTEKATYIQELRKVRN